MGEKKCSIALIIPFIFSLGTHNSRLLMQKSIAQHLLSQAREALRDPEFWVNLQLTYLSFSYSLFPAKKAN